MTNNSHFIGFSQNMVSQGKTIGYLRVSTGDQDLEKNKAAILRLVNDKQLGSGHVSFVKETASGKKPWRERRIAAVMGSLDAGDHLVVSEISRLGRSMLEVMEILSIATDRKIRVYAVKGDWELTDNIQSKILAMVFSMAAEIEHDLISQRTREALRVKKARGERLGRPPGPGKSKLDPFRPEIESLLSNGATKTFVAKRYGSSVSNLHRWLKRHRSMVFRPC